MSAKRRREGLNNRVPPNKKHRVSSDDDDSDSDMEILSKGPRMAATMQIFGWYVKNSNGDLVPEEMPINEYYKVIIFIFIVIFVIIFIFILIFGVCFRYIVIVLIYKIII